MQEHSPSLSSSTSPRLSTSRRPLLARQFSSPLPPPPTRGLVDSGGGGSGGLEMLLMRQTSVPTPNSSSPRSKQYRGVSDGGQPVELLGDGSRVSGLEKADGVANSFGGKRSNLAARMRSIGTSHRNGKQNSDPLMLVESRSPENVASSDGMDDPPVASLNGEELKHVMDRAIRYFNLNPKIGMKFLKEKRVTYVRRDSPEANARRVALFLKNTKGLNKAKIGQLLGTDALVLREYVGTFDFRKHQVNVQGVEAGLREMLSFFKPPGEGQQIDRVLEAFAGRFASHCEPKLTKDMIHQLAFLIILLNVGLHNPNAKGKNSMTRDQCITLYSAEPSFKDCTTREELGALYDSVQRSELKHEEDREDVAGNLFTDPEMSGVLEIRLFNSRLMFPRIHSRWSSRWVILSQNTLYYFKKSTDVDFEGFIPLENLRLLTENSVMSPSLQRRHLSSSQHTSPRETESATALPVRPPISASSPGNSLESNTPTETLNQTSVSQPKPRLARLVSCPGFRTSQSSINTGGTTASSSRSRASFLRSLTKRSATPGPYTTFLLASIENDYFVKSARLNKSHLRKSRGRKKGGGELVMQQNLYIGFRTRERSEFDDWVRILRQKGLLKSKATFMLQKSGAGGWGAAKFRLLSPTYSLPTSFSAEEFETETEVTEIGDESGSTIPTTMATIFSSAGVQSSSLGSPKNGLAIVGNDNLVIA